MERENELVIASPPPPAQPRPPSITPMAAHRANHADLPDGAAQAHASDTPHATSAIQAPDAADTRKAAHVAKPSHDRGAPNNA
jgi:hypothetical protein